MAFRHTMKGRTVLTAVAITSGLVLTVAGCGGGGDDDKPDKTAVVLAACQGQTSGDDKDKESQAPAAEQALAEVKGGRIYARHHVGRA